MRLLVVTAAALSLAAGATADIGVVSVTPPIVRPGQVVRVHVNGYLPLRTASMPLVLVPTEQMPRPYPCKHGLCTPIVWRGRLAHPPYRIVGFAMRWTRSRREYDHADAFARVRIPTVASARYTVALWCGPCVRGPQGSLIAGPPLTVR
jgi:hypothetical protein